MQNPKATRCNPTLRHVLKIILAIYKQNVLSWSKRALDTANSQAGFRVEGLRFRG